MSEWKDKIILITGAGSGIGRALSEHFAELQARLVLTDLNEQNLITVAEGVKSRVVEQRVLDVSDCEAWRNLQEHLAQNYGYIDVVINNAGMSNFDFFEQSSEQQFNRVMEVNFNGVVNGCRYMLPLLNKAHRGLIVNLASVFSFITVPGLTAYHASKFAVRGFSSALKQDLTYQGSSVDVICVMPGGIKTNIAKNSVTQSLNVAKYAEHFETVARTTPKKAACVIEKGMRRRGFKVLVGPDAKVLSVIYRLFQNSYHKITNYLLGVDKVIR